eukprot:scaffold22516_cov92-Skeletonema_marinoi.AAC.1
MSMSSACIQIEVGTTRLIPLRERQVFSSASSTSTIVLVYGSLSTIQMPPQIGIDGRSQRM